MKKILFIVLISIFTCTVGKAQVSLPIQYLEVVKKLVSNLPNTKINLPSSTSPSCVIDFAKTMLGIPYHYATSNPKIGFDCSGFVSYVFTNFGFKVPRSSAEFSATGKETNLEHAKVGDILIFTGTNPKVRRVGHVGIIYSIDDNGIKFIHATSGKANGVTITEFNDYYKSRFMKVVSII